MKSHTLTKRSPVVTIMGHIDHGKSTLLTYIRNQVQSHTGKPQVQLTEAGGITQHISAYEISHHGAHITFLDTPGHAAFTGHRSRGAHVADVAVLVVSAEDGVKPQTLEALESIKKNGVPFIVAITKIDKPEAQVVQTKTSLAENGVYVEGFGGDVSVVEVSATSGAGVHDLLDMIMLTSDIANLQGDPSLGATGLIIESNLNIRKGISAVCIIKNGTLRKGMFVGASGCLAPVRIVEDWKGKALREASFSQPVTLFGWDVLPKVGSAFQAFETKKEAEGYAKIEVGDKRKEIRKETEEKKLFPVVLKADAGGSIEAIMNQIEQLQQEKIRVQITSAGIGTISESDIRLAQGSVSGVVIGFHVSVDTRAKQLAERDGITIQTFDVIYNLTEWLEEKLRENAPTEEVEEETGVAKVLKTFSKVKDKQIIGCRMEKGVMKVGSDVKVMRRDAEIALGNVRELQSQKVKISEAEEGKEFGTLVECKIEIMPGDRLHAFTIVRK